MQKNKSLNWSIYLILFMIIILLIILLFTNYGKIDVLMPTGNIDIFDIIIENNCECEECDVPVFKDDDISQGDSNIDNDGELSVFDKVGDFKNQQYLNIFSNPAFEMKTIIAPGSSNAYQFVVRNGNNYNIQYNIKMKETNIYNINIKFRLKQNGKYIIGDDKTWVNADSLIIEKVKLATKSNMPYVLEWKWFDSDNDTEIGKIDDSDYKLAIQVEATMI